MNNSDLLNSQPVLRFSLKADPDDVVQVLAKLRILAQEQDFRHVSEIMEFKGEECCAEEGDPTEFLKLEARGIALANNRLLTFWPERFRAFVCQMPNKRLMTIGFAKYPDLVKAGSGREFITPWLGKEIWHGTISTKDSRFIVSRDDCRRSHQAATNLLMHASSFRVLTLVEDMTGFWESQCEKDLDILCPSSAQPDCQPRT